MTLTDIQTIESELGLRLPDEYRTIMTSDHAHLEGGFWYAALYNDPRRIVADTRELREVTASYGTPCPDSWVVVSEVNGGDPVILPVLPVRSIPDAVAWYEKVLGYQTHYIHADPADDDPANYAILRRDATDLHLILDEPAPHAHPYTRAGTGYLYLLVDDVDALHAHATAKNIPLSRPLQSEPWGPRAFNLQDPSGNTLHLEQSR